MYNWSKFKCFNNASTSSTTVDNVNFTSGYNSGEIDDTGDVMYIENRSPITRRLRSN